MDRGEEKSSIPLTCDDTLYGVTYGVRARGIRDHSRGREVAMTTFDLSEVLGFAADLDSQMDRCDNGEGIECSTLDAALVRYANLCCKFRDQVREWGRAVFSGRVAYDPDVECAWLDEALRVYKRATDMWTHGQESEGQCYILEGRIFLQAALWDLYRLLSGWVTPKLAVGPSARRERAAANGPFTDEVRRRVASLPPLPSSWQPDHVSQRALYRKAPKS